MYDLPSEEIGDAGMPDEYHIRQATLLDETFRPPTTPPDEVFSAIDMNLYYDGRNPLWCKRPDWFGVIGAPRLYKGRESRLSYVIWEESVDPLIVVELLSPGTEKEDLGQTLRDVSRPPTKWQVYEQILRVPYYAVYSREGADLKIFQLMGASYKEITGHGGRFWIAKAGLGLGLWQGRYHEQERLWLRWYDANDDWVPTHSELVGEARVKAEQERQKAEQERQKAEQERQKAQQERQKAEQERQKAEQERQKAEQERMEKEFALSREAQQRQRAEQSELLLEQERERAARLEELLRQMGREPGSP
jgi:Uma2 family endonuclease